MSCLEVGALREKGGYEDTHRVLEEGEPCRAQEEPWGLERGCQGSLGDLEPDMVPRGKLAFWRPRGHGTAAQCWSVMGRAPLARSHSPSALAVMPGRGEEAGRDQPGGHMKASPVPSLSSGSFLGALEQSYLLIS